MIASTDRVVCSSNCSTSLRSGAGVFTLPRHVERIVDEEGFPWEQPVVPRDLLLQWALQGSNLRPLDYESTALTS
jgi:hypothetical protein